MARNLIWILGGGSVVAGIVVGAWFMMQRAETPSEPGTVPVPQASAPAPTPAPAPAADEPTETAVAPVEAADTEATPADTATETAAASPPEPVLPAPLFDVVRISREGDGLVAGSAQAGAGITLRVDAAVVAQGMADAQGQFVLLFALAPSDVAQVLTLEATDAEGRVAEAAEQIILAPRPAIAVAAADPVTDPAPQPAPQPAADTAAVATAPSESAPTSEAPPQVVTALPEPAQSVEPAATETAAIEPTPQTGSETGTQTAAESTAVASVDAPATDTTAEPATETALASAATAVTPPADTPTAFAVSRDGAVRLLDRQPEVQNNVVVDSISYAADGEVLIAGRAADPASGGGLRIYLDNRPIASAPITARDWAADLPDVDPGVYTLRVDQLADTGQVVSRFETPFLRETPQAVARSQEATAQSASATDGANDAAAASTVAPAPLASLITVQPGHTLWAISRDRYGAGELYVQIYRANRDQIRDPDLIYPGQIFTLPGD